MNPNAIVFWAFCTGVGFLIAGTLTGAITGLVIGLGFSLFITALIF